MSASFYECGVCGKRHRRYSLGKRHEPKYLGAERRRAARAKAKEERVTLEKTILFDGLLTMMSHGWINAFQRNDGEIVFELAEADGRQPW